MQVAERSRSATASASQAWCDVPPRRLPGDQGAASIRALLNRLNLERLNRVNREEAEPEIRS